MYVLEQVNELNGLILRSDVFVVKIELISLEPTRIVINIFEFAIEACFELAVVASNGVFV